MGIISQEELNKERYFLAIIPHIEDYKYYFKISTDKTNFSFPLEKSEFMSSHVSGGEINKEVIRELRDFLTNILDGKE